MAKIVKGNIEATGEIKGATIVGALTGTADIATEVTVSANNSTDETVYLTFVDGATGTQGLETDTGLTYNPSTNQISATTSGSIAVQNVTGAGANSHYVPVVNTFNGNSGLFGDANLEFNSSTNTLSTTAFTGALTGNVAGDVTGGVSLPSGKTITGLHASNAITITGDITAGNNGADSNFVRGPRVEGKVITHRPTDSELVLSSIGDVKAVIDNNGGTTNYFSVHTNTSSSGAVFTVSEAGAVNSSSSITGTSLSVGTGQIIAGSAIISGNITTTTGNMALTAGNLRLPNTGCITGLTNGTVNVSNASDDSSSSGNLVKLNVVNNAQSDSILDIAEIAGTLASETSRTGVRIQYDGDAGSPLNATHIKALKELDQSDGENLERSVIRFTSDADDVLISAYEDYNPSLTEAQNNAATRSQLVLTDTLARLQFSLDGTDSNRYGISNNQSNTGFAVWQNNFTVYGRFDLGTLYAHSLPEDSDTTINTFTMGVKTTGEVYKDNSGFFTGTHIYKAASDIAPGTAVELVSGSVQATSSANSAICVGIVTQTQEASEDNPIETSLGESLTSGWGIKLASVGDVKHRNSTGFLICNEGGAIVPGNLLVTSSTAGYLMRQTDDIIRSTTVGKAMESPSFDENGQASGIYGYIYCG